MGMRLRSVAAVATHFTVALLRERFAGSCLACAPGGRLHRAIAVG